MKDEGIKIYYFEFNGEMPLGIWCVWSIMMQKNIWIDLLTYIDLRLTSLLFFDHSTRGQRRWDVIFLTFSLKSRKTISFKHSSTLSTSINYGLCAFFDILNTMASQIHGEIIDSIALQPYKVHYILGNLKDISQNVHEKISSFDLYIYRKQLNDQFWGKP